ncbi:hypothetical protein CWR48_04940 [Oceanobacillus arenosus]|uniref:Uncharacterized protein n=1 Tax=Oceanobacillus arenosus TaxID=1229153 RepID=A0A3D8PVI1_9BACI|nr:hypothetical protein [Oceanobacillus arenosus]RDW20073.1 hypothetical protein CWR48_04940 [Oceanobacillus arenosus]
MVKKIISLFVVALMVTAAVINPFAVNVANAETSNLSEDNLKLLGKIFDETKSSQEQFTLVDEVKDLDGSVLQTITSDVNLQVDKDEEKGVINIKITTDATTVSTSANDPIEKTQKVDEITYTKDGDVYVNGEKLSSEELNQTFTIPKNDLNVGKTYLTYYNETSKNYYQMRAYQKPSNAFLDGNNGVYRQKYSYGNYNVSDFKTLTRGVSTARDNIAQSSVWIVGAMGGAALSWFTVVSLLAAGGTIAVHAVIIWNNSSAGKADMTAAYNLLNRF